MKIGRESISENLLVSVDSKELKDTDGLWDSVACQESLYRVNTFPFLNSRHCTAKSKLPPLKDENAKLPKRSFP
jgi:hypothetical protein